VCPFLIVSDSACVRFIQLAVYDLFCAQLGRSRREYLQQLQQRNKWQLSKGLKPNIGNMVMIQEEDLLPLKWLVGRIEGINPGKDGVTRVVSIRTTKDM